MWILLSLSSAVLLGFYDLAKKKSVHENAVPPVLFLNVLTAGAIYLPLIFWASVGASGDDVPSSSIATLTWTGHGRLFLKSLLVGASWNCAFFALKHLPLSIATPIRATSPMWTILVAVGVLGERPSTLQWLGILLLLAAFATFSSVGKMEGIRFDRNRWVGLMVLATLLGAISSLYDKYLLQSCGYSPVQVQAWFSVYLCVVMLPLAAHWYVFERKKVTFEFRWTIPAIAITLLAADYLYFSAIAYDQAMISLISPLRRTSVMIPFLFGVVVLAEKSWKPKLACLIGMLIGVFFISMG